MRTAGVNEPRFDHDPITGQSLGLLIEEQRTNLLTYSDDFNSWTKFLASVSSNTATAPDGNTTADTIIQNAGSIQTAVRQDVSGLADNTTYTFSIFLKAAGIQLNNITLQFYNKANTFHGSKILNCFTGTLSGSDFVGTSSVVSYGNGWYRLIITNLGSGTGATTPNVRIITTSIGNGTSGIYLWGAQLEQGAFPTSYIPTTSSTVTRSADTANIANISSFFNASEGTLFVDSEMPYQTNLKFPSIGFTRGAGSGNTIQFFYTNANIPYVQFLVRDTAGGRGQDIYLASPNQTVGVYKKFIGTYKVGEYNFYFDGKYVGRTTPNKNLPSSLSMLEIGTNSPFNFDRLNGHIRRITYYPIQLTNQQLINLCI
jgi:hypothetical protein